jgi:hypothetical protein
MYLRCLRAHPSGWVCRNEWRPHQINIASAIRLDDGVGNTFAGGAGAATRNAAYVEGRVSPLALMGSGIQRCSDRIDALAIGLRVRQCHDAIDSRSC